MRKAAIQRVKRITLVLIPSSHPGYEEQPASSLPEWKPEPQRQPWWHEWPLGFILFVVVLAFLLWLSMN